MVGEATARRLMAGICVGDGASGFKLWKGVLVGVIAAFCKFPSTFWLAMDRMQEGGAEEAGPIPSRGANARL